MTNFEKIRKEMRTFEGTLEIFSKMSADGCILDKLTDCITECPSDCTCRQCIETWLSAEHMGG